ncbi:MAG: hypothetical protein OER56_11670 [Hyphomicrobiales bacterium]|nr:hypothetical protein [Hyphomicrobiales bacterium]
MFRNTVLAAMAAAIAITAATNTASAGNYRGVTTIWVSVHAYPGEGLWEACRRVYQHDVYKVRGGYGIDEVRCEIDHSRIGG